MREFNIIRSLDGRKCQNAALFKTVKGKRPPICNTMPVFNSAKPAISLRWSPFPLILVLLRFVLYKIKHHRCLCKQDAVIRTQDTNICHVYRDVNVQVSLHVGPYDFQHHRIGLKTNL